MSVDLSKFDEPIREFAEGLVEEMKDYPFELVGYNYSEVVPEEAGVHILLWRLKEGEEEFNIGDHPELEAILSQDDDGQPHRSYRVFLDDLWVYIPFYA